ncbi:hypothetical protein GLAREA_11324 [Glarea lozoyensis ATCC 20868]|uniref:Heterokaryon incompatibility domain-containing protein n=1 Tax=Glarea lozoyensis (strain ATCC 20868 / MF5171) TaxID=1116229 RepID=S3DET4_GLAL2|nr:uncharacterized protein GLAREA_11324 [Glarea lozoyensis ATCC 20868]EPE35624.1 hypothetical protein GLAREA_11324 [Glarea lozoyensis ATCC 20868]
MSINAATQEMQSGCDPTTDNVDGEEKIYQYQPIEDGMIRVILLQPTETRLECSIRKVKLSEARYQALSYEWGGVDTPFRIQVLNDEDEPLGAIPLTTNLDSALQNLRTAPTIKSKIFWIDQISINQNDDEEKSHQVALMGDIYENAQQVITYLGPHSSDLDLEFRALGLLDRLTRHFALNLPHIASAKGISRCLYDETLLPVREVPPDVSDSDVEWRALVRIIYGAWLRRLWMVQENFLCPRNIMLRGKIELDWTSVVSVVLLFELQVLPTKVVYDEWPFLRISRSTNDVLNQILPTWERRCAFVDDRNIQLNSLVMNLHLCASLDCKDPRDKIYAVLGISSDIKDLEIVPDYNLSFQDLYVYVSCRIYLTSQELLLLRFIGGQSVDHNSDLPSWSYHGLPKTEMDVRKYHPHPSTKCNVRFEEVNKVMVVRGRVLSRIRFVSSPVDSFAPSTTATQRRLYYIQVIEAIISMLDEVNNEETLSQLVSALLPAPRWGPLDNHFDDVFCLWCVCRYFAAVSIKRPSPIGTSSIEKVPEHLRKIGRLYKGPVAIDLEDIWSELNEHEQHLVDEVIHHICMEGRAFALSQDNQVFNTTCQAREGDVVALLAGGNLSYILRLVEERYVYIGDAYARHLKDGAAYEGMSPEEVDEEIRLI